MSDHHPLLSLLLAAAAGSPPPPDGEVIVWGSTGDPLDAVVAFTAHHAICLDVDQAEVDQRLPPGDFGAPVHPSFLTWLGARTGREPGILDAVLAGPAAVGPPSGGMELDERVDLPDHPRVRRAGRYRTDLRVWTTLDEHGVLVVGRGLVGRWEAAFEVDPAFRGRGVGRALAAAARHAVPPGDFVFVQVSPGNAASMRAVLAAGYRPIAAEVLFTPSSSPTGTTR